MTEAVAEIQRQQVLEEQQNHQAPQLDLMGPMDKISEEEIEDAVRQAMREMRHNSIREVHQIFTHIHSKLNEIGILFNDTYVTMRETQKESYAAMKKSYVKKAWLSLLGIAGAVFQIAATPIRNATAKGILESLSKVTPPISQFFTTMEEGNAQGPLTYAIRLIEGNMEKLRQDQQKGYTQDESSFHTATNLKQIFSKMYSEGLGLNG
ncbi:MAG: hypothetical protein MRY21_08145 [Simkaniaceae bacterium]|nr:hypothetical protein [Simkaniaceae bacterium]